MFGYNPIPFISAFLVGMRFSFCSHEPPGASWVSPRMRILNKGRTDFEKIKYNNGHRETTYIQFVSSPALLK